MRKRGSLFMNLWLSCQIKRKQQLPLPKPKIMKHNEPPKEEANQQKSQPPSEAENQPQSLLQPNNAAVNEELPNLSPEAQAELIRQLQQYKAGFEHMEEAFVAIIHSADRIKQEMTPLLVQFKPKKEGQKPTAASLMAKAMNPKTMNKITSTIGPLFQEEFMRIIFPIVTQYLTYYPRTDGESTPT